MIDAHAFFEEISRQFGDAVPEAAAELRALRLQSAEERSLQTGREARRSLPRRLLARLGEIAGQTGRTVLVVLDTVEVLRSLGETLVMTLFDHLDRLVEFGMPAIVVLSAGRGDALDPVPQRVAAQLRLDGLEQAAAEALLDKRGVARSLWPQVLTLARGNPLLLTLAAKALEGGGLDAMGLLDVATDETIGGYLYRAILSRVPRRLSRVANEGLILQKINPQSLVDVVAPALGMTLDEATATQMLGELTQQHWLVENDPGPGGWIRHRSDVRTAFLPLIYADSPEPTAEINRRAAGWFANRDPVAALYHRLQLVRAGEPLPDIPAKLARAFTDTMRN